MTAPRTTAVPDARLLTCAECHQPFEAPRIGRPPSRCSLACTRAVRARREREYRRALVRDREELAALRQVLRQVAA